ncbi:NHL repeat-containing protein [Flavilitoribacter nigricans]|uniref:6-bladed beta-propeller n=1 Tax=Flavilitoribacter nigricans (strain ATCC 23147 / DSM 23189 / NBRC 102662 / NCIMB 1420 / SS-2) TaxID=1122177 RepID=A0A2D0N4P1_FLAN2|nr:6-bladed beta-propeller [Flavilitoribacter nigricans]PHN02753.1 6-bladed beta-propeller [Flavilitoribacter nigricans DSM 23189 = NBRC 102662]
MKRRTFIRQSSVTIAASGGFGFNLLGRAKKEEIVGHGDYQYRIIRDWAQISSVQNPILNCHEMVMDRQGRLIMMGDHPANNILIFDKSGKLLDYWGTAYPGGHGLTLSAEGEEDFLFLTDSGWFLDKHGKWVRHNGRVSKTTLDGRVIFDIGHPQTVGVYKPGDHFCPTETAIGPNGDIYVADGYGMDYIIQYNARGEYIRHWGGHNNHDKNYNLHNAHGVAIDYRDAENPLVVCTSRNEQSFKFFTLDGQYVRTLHLPNMQVCRPVFDDSNLYAGVCWSQPKEGKTTWKDHTGFITILEGDTVVSNPGGTAPAYKDGALQKSYQLAEKPILHGHDVCVDEDKNLYICQWNANGTPPLKLERVNG